MDKKYWKTIPDVRDYRTFEDCKMPHAIKYFGGKFYIADWIISLMPKHTMYGEVFGGGAAVLIRKAKITREVYNDIWQDVVNFFTCLRDHSDEMIKWTYLSPYSKILHDEYYKKWIDRDFKDNIEKACIFFYLNSTSINGLSFKQFSTSTMLKQGRDYGNKMLKLFKLAERFRGIILDSKDFRDFIEFYDNPKMHLYVDPPYFDVSMYEHEFKFRDHYDLSKKLKNTQATWQLSYYDHPEIYKLYPKDEFTIVKKTVTKSMDARRRTHPDFKAEKTRVDEVLVMNYKPKTKNRKKSKLLKELLIK